MVVISYTSDNDFFKGKIESFPVTRFLLELTQHIPPRGLQYIRRYGLYASRTKGKWPDMPHVMRLAPAGWKAERRHSSMNVIAVITDPEEVHKILRHLVKIGRSPPGLDPNFV